MKRSLLLAALLLVSSFSVYAEEAKVLSVYEKVSIIAPAGKVWSKISDFDDFGWHPDVESAKNVSITFGAAYGVDSLHSKVCAESAEGAEGAEGGEGIVRLLNLNDGRTIKLKLLAYNDKGKTFKYSFIEGGLPVSDYVSSLTVKANGKYKSVVVWKGTFKHIEGSDDATALRAMTSFHRSGLDNLKSISEDHCCED